MADCKFFTPVLAENCTFTEDLRYLNTQNNSNERELYAKYFLEQIEQWGTEVEYQVNNHLLSSDNTLYGEHTTRIFDNPKPIIMYVAYNDDSIVLNQFGIESMGDITAFISISSYKATFGEDAEPNSGDLIRLSEYGSTNRPNNRGAEVFEVTNRDDQIISQTVPLIGHYVWMIWGKRYDYSYENNVTPENTLNQVNDDNTLYSDLSGSASLSSVTDRINPPIDETNDDLGKLIFDYSKDTKSNDSIYGDY